MIWGGPRCCSQNLFISWLAGTFWNASRWRHDMETFSVLMAFVRRIYRSRIKRGTSERGWGRGAVMKNAFIFTLQKYVEPIVALLSIQETHVGSECTHTLICGETWQIQQTTPAWEMSCTCTIFFKFCIWTTVASKCEFLYLLTYVSLLPCVAQITNTRTYFNMCLTCLILTIFSKYAAYKWD